MTRNWDDPNDDYGALRGPDTLRVSVNRKPIIVCGAERAPMLRAIQPMLATLVNKPFVDAEWIFGTKWDGVRALCFIENGQARFISRSQRDMTFRYPELKNLPQRLRTRQAILDDEIVVSDKQGASRFQTLEDALERLAKMQTRSKRKRRSTRA